MMNISNLPGRAWRASGVIAILAASRTDAMGGSSAGRFCLKKTKIKSSRRARDTATEAGSALTPGRTGVMSRAAAHWLMAGGSAAVLLTAIGLLVTLASQVRAFAS